MMKNKVSNASLAAKTAFVILLFSEFSALPHAAFGQAASTAPSAAKSPQSTMLKLPLKDAILMALENNRGLRVERLSPQIAALAKDTAKAAFDPALKAELSRNRSTANTDSTQGELGVSKLFSPGTSVAVEVSGASSETPAGIPGDQARASLGLTQPLLQGAGRSVNLARVRQAEMDDLSSQYEFRGFVEAFVASVDENYWNTVLAERQISIIERSLNLAQQQAEQTKISVEAGALAPTELPAAEAEVAQRRKALIEAQGQLDLARLQFMRLGNLSRSGMLSGDFELTDAPDAPEVRLEDTATHVRRAQARRPELNQARLAISRGELDVVRTRNGRLPKLDLFITLGQTGYASQFDRAVKDMPGSKNDDAAIGLMFSYPFAKRADKAALRKAELSREQSEEALDNLSQLVELDVRSSLIELQRDLAAIDAAAALRRLREETLRAETEKFKNGRSTALMVAQAQRDFMASEVDEIEAKIKSRKDLSRFRRYEGTLLEFYGLSVPGAEAAAGPDNRN